VDTQAIVKDINYKSGKKTSQQQVDSRGFKRKEQKESHIQKCERDTKQHCIFKYQRLNKYKYYKIQHG
jgi:hypothetical protein